MIARVFPRKTTATPTDSLAFCDVPPMIGLPEIDEVHVSVVFTYDVAKAEWLARQWEAVGVPVKLGGPAFNVPGGEFIPGMYLKMGDVITSRGCSNNCWFCSVPKREGKTRELTIHDGWNVRDDNLLACSDNHIHAVFEMLERQPERPNFSGGLEAKILKPWHAELIKKVKTKSLYMAYDMPDDLEPLREAGKVLREAGITTESHTARCYVLIGYRGDSFADAERRLIATIDAGFMPFAMLYKNDHGEVDREWRRFQCNWCRPVIVASKMAEQRRYTQ